MGEEITLGAYYFVLILVRIIGFLVIAPIFGSRTVSNRVKISLGLIMAILFLPIVPVSQIEVSEQVIMIVFQIIIEFFIGFIIGFIMLLSFIAVQIAGQFIDTRMGFAMVSLIDPQNGMQSPLTGQFKNIVAILIFLGVNGHHYLLKALGDSFYIIKINKFQNSSQLIWALIRIIGDLFSLAFKISLPILAILFIVDLAFALVSKVVPQINVFMMGIPTKIFVGIIFLSLILGGYTNSLHGIFEANIEKIYNVLKLMVERG